MAKNQNQTQLTFAVPEARELPKKVCVGVVEGVGEAKVSQSGQYVVQPIHLAPFGTGQKARVNFLYRPEWIQLTAEGGIFDPASIAEAAEDGTPEEIEAARKMTTVYRMHIRSSKDGQMSTLRGLAGSDDNFNELANRILSISEFTLPAVTDVLSEFFDEYQPTIGYMLKQSSQKTGEFDDEGKEIKVLGERYDLGSFFDASPKALDRWRNSAARNGGIIVCVAEDDDSIPF